MSNHQMLSELGESLKTLCAVLYGKLSSPHEKIPELSAHTGINKNLIEAALLASERE